MIWRLIWITRASDTKDIRTLVKQLRALGQERQQALDRERAALGRDSGYGL